METSIKSKKARMEEGIMPIKTLRARGKITLSSVTIHSVQFFKFRFEIVLFGFMNFEIL